MRYKWGWVVHVQSMQGEEDDEGWMAEGAAELEAQLRQRELEMGAGSEASKRGAEGEADAADIAARIKAHSLHSLRP